MSFQQKISTIKPSVVKVISVISRSGQQVNASVGSGFIVSPNGHIITNEHVIKNHDPKNNYVQLSSGRRYRVNNLLHLDKTYDYAILETRVPINQTVTLGTFGVLNEGDDIYCCGYPFGYNNHTVHRGYISSLFVENNIDQIQLDASINSGNSGGPLLSYPTDEVVGIITRKAGGVGVRLENLSTFLLQAPTVFSAGFTTSTGQTVTVDPLKTTAQVIQILHEYSNVGIGFAYSIEYAKQELENTGII